MDRKKKQNKQNNKQTKTDVACSEGNNTFSFVIFDWNHVLDLNFLRIPFRAVFLEVNV